MSIATEITRLQNAKNDLKTSINAKTDASHKITNETINDYADFVDSIETGGGSATINIYKQLIEPEEKKGLWLKTDAISDEKLIFTTSMGISEAWSTDTFTNTPKQVLNTGGVQIGDYIYLIGGSYAGNDNYKYNPATDTYTTNTNLPFNFYRSVAVKVGTNVYLMGSGYVSGDMPKSNYKYDTTNDTYTKMANIPYNFYNGSAIAIGTDIYLFGGTGNKTNSYKYNTLTDTYTQLASIPYNFEYGDVAVVGTKIYLFGGSSNATNLYTYDTVTNSYSNSGITLPYNFTYGKVAHIGNYVYLFGGSSGTTAYKLDLTNNQFTRIANIPITFSSGTVVLFNDKIYLFGGTDQTYKVRRLDLTLQSVVNNSIVVRQSTQLNNSYNTELFDYDLYSGKILFPFYDFYYVDNNGETVLLEKYYGDGTQWVQI